MTPNRITMKFFIENMANFAATAVVPIFHHWIQTEAAPGLLIDVADYKHVPDGPGIILIGHEVDYALDFGGGRAGFLTRRKRLQEGTLAGNLQGTLDWALAASGRFAQDTGLSLRPDEIEITFPDRLHAPNNAETFAALHEETVAVLQKVYGAVQIELVNGAVDGRRPLTMHARLANAPEPVALSY